MTRRDHPEIKCTRCGVTVKEDRIAVPSRCLDRRCPLNAMVAAKSEAQAGDRAA